MLHIDIYLTAAQISIASSIVIVIINLLVDMDEEITYRWWNSIFIPITPFVYLITGVHASENLSYTDFIAIFLWLLLLRKHIELYFKR